MLPGLQTGRFDAVVSNINVLEERKAVFDFSVPYSRSAVVAITRASAKDINSYKDLKDKVVGAITGGADGEIPARQISAPQGLLERIAIHDDLLSSPDKSMILVVRMRISFARWNKSVRPDRAVNILATLFLAPIGQFIEPRDDNIRCGRGLEMNRFVARPVFFGDDRFAINSGMNQNGVAG